MNAARAPLSVQRLSERQREVALYVRGHWVEQQTYPSVAEIARACGLSVQQARNAVATLQSNGVLFRERDQALVVTPAWQGALDRTLNEAATRPLSPKARAVEHEARLAGLRARRDALEATELALEPVLAKVRADLRDVRRELRRFGAEPSPVSAVAVNPPASPAPASTSRATNPAPAWTRRPAVPSTPERTPPAESAPSSASPGVTPAAYRRVCAFVAGLLGDEPTIDAWAKTDELFRSFTAEEQDAARGALRCVVNELTARSAATPLPPRAAASPGDARDAIALASSRATHWAFYTAAGVCENADYVSPGLRRPLSGVQRATLDLALSQLVAEFTRRYEATGVVL